MFHVLRERFKQKYRTIAFPKQEPVLPDRFRGKPCLDLTKCPADCRACAGVCPTHAISKDSRGLVFDLGKCLFCTDCMAACPGKIIGFDKNYRLSANRRQDLFTFGDSQPGLLRPLDDKRRKLFRSSLRLRQVSAGGCNACEPDLNVLTTAVFDISRFGIQFVASPRHADGILVTGPVTPNMELALKKTYDACSEPKIVIACGACAISGGLYRGDSVQQRGADSILPVDLYIPGCPPHPVTILDGLLRLLGQNQKKIVSGLKIVI